MFKEWLGWLLPNPQTTLESQLAAPLQRNALLEALKAIKSQPPLPDEVDTYAIIFSHRQACSAAV